MKLGVCYYPEQWPEKLWADDAKRMREAGLSRVRIGEFAWSRIEPEPGRFDWAWLDRAIATLHAAGLEVILGTPTATPPKWLVDAKPDILAWDEDGRPRRFGSRRHYCFSSAAFRQEAARICSEVARRYGEHPAVVAWQTDNEYGCHNTVLSYSPWAGAAFRTWLEARYTFIAALNEAWGTAFWSQDYRSFDEVDRPNLTVTEANPAHRMDYQRFASDEVVSFNRMQAEIIRRTSPGRDVVHNFMGFFTAFDHHAVAEDLDVATWDSYPLGFLDQGWDDAQTKEVYLRQGHPDFAAFHHDLYRGCGRGRMWVIEQQPGPVNWAPNNPAPLPGMVRLWTLEALAHGAELVSYFRWRQAPFGQEQMHAGILRPDHKDGPAAEEVRTVAAEIASLPSAPGGRAAVALLFSYEAQWMLGIQPQGEAFDPLRLSFEFYTALRSLGLDVDILPPDADLDGYSLIVAPSLPVLDEQWADRLKASSGHILFGPRSGSKTREFQIPAELPPGPLQAVLPLRVSAVESLRPGHFEPVPDREGRVINWLEHVETELVPRLSTVAGKGIWFQSGRAHYLAGWPDASLMLEILATLVAECGLSVRPLPQGVRLRRHGQVEFAFNYGPRDADMAGLIREGAPLLLGDLKLPPAGVAAWAIA
jgi:beta-galactosidase